MTGPAANAAVDDVGLQAQRRALFTPLEGPLAGLWRVGANCATQQGIMVNWIFGGTVPHNEAR